MASFHVSAYFTVHRPYFRISFRPVHAVWSEDTGHWSPSVLSPQNEGCLGNFNALKGLSFEGPLISPRGQHVSIDTFVRKPIS